LSKVCFVIGPIGPPESVIRTAADDLLKYMIQPTVKALDYDDPIRADKLPEPGRITSQIIELLQTADLVIADLSGHNANVYYELSYRHAIGKSAIIMAPEGTTLSFDVFDARTIPYTMHAPHVDRAKGELTAQIQKTHEPGYKPRNLIVDTVGLMNLEKSTHPTQRAIVVLAHDVQGLRNEFANLRSQVTLVLNQILTPGYSDLASPFGTLHGGLTGPTGPSGGFAGLGAGGLGLGGSRGPVGGPGSLNAIRFVTDPPRQKKGGQEDKD
jgi:hypothetical protein